MLKKIYQAIVLASPSLKMPHPLLPVVLMMPVSETVTMFGPPVAEMPLSVPVVTKAPVTVTVSAPFIVLLSLVVVPDVMVKSSAITGVAKARQTKADVPSNLLCEILN